MSLPSAKIRLSLELFERVLTGLRSGTIPAVIEEYIDLENGTTDGSACDKMYQIKESAKAASSTTSYDLAGGALTDIDGATVTFAEVCLICLINKRTTALAYILVGPHTTNGFGVLAAGKGFWGAHVTAGGGNIIGPAGTPTPGNSGGSWVCLYDYTGVPVGAGATDVLAVVCSAVFGDINAWEGVIIGRSA